MNHDDDRPVDLARGGLRLVAGGLLAGLALTLSSPGIPPLRRADPEPAAGDSAAEIDTAVFGVG